MRVRRHLAPLFLVGLLLTSLPHAPLYAAKWTCKPLKSGERIQVDFKEVALEKVVRVVSCAIEANIIVKTATLKARRVSLIASAPVSRGDLLPLLEAALRQAGLALSTRAGYWVVHEASPQEPSKRRSKSGR